MPGLNDSRAGKTIAGEQQVSYRAEVGYVIKGKFNVIYRTEDHAGGARQITVTQG
jgi:hypothetical protein